MADVTDAAGDGGDGDEGRDVRRCSSRALPDRSADDLVANGEDPDLVDRKGLVDVARACIENNVSRLVVISGAGVGTCKSPRPWRQPERELGVGLSTSNAMTSAGRMDAKLAGRTSFETRRDGHWFLTAAAAGRTKGDVASYVRIVPAACSTAAVKGVRALAVNQGDEAAGFIAIEAVVARVVDAAETAVEGVHKPKLRSGRKDHLRRPHCTEAGTNSPTLR